MISFAQEKAQPPVRKHPTNFHARIKVSSKFCFHYAAALYGTVYSPEHPATGAFLNTVDTAKPRMSQLPTVDCSPRSQCIDDFPQYSSAWRDRPAETSGAVAAHSL